MQPSHSQASICIIFTSGTRKNGTFCAQNNVASRNQARHFNRNDLTQGIGLTDTDRFYLGLGEKSLGLSEPRSSREGPCTAEI